MVPAASVLLALRSHGKPFNPVALTDAGFTISVQCWSLKEFTLWEAIEMVAIAGASAIEVFPGQRIGGDLGDMKLGTDMTDDQIATLLEHARRNGVVPVSLGVVPISKREKEARKTFDFARKLGLQGVATESLDALDTLEKLAQEYDIKVCFHNHPKPTSLWNPDKIWDSIKDRHTNLGFCGDLGHWITSGLDPLVVIQKVGPRVHSIHMKDRGELGAWTHDRPFGTGVVEIAAILDEVRRHGFAGHVTIEYEHNWKSNVPEIAQCVGYLRAYSKLRKKV